MEKLWRDYFLEWLEKEIPSLVERELTFSLSSSITAIVGPRRAGKTFFLYQIAKSLINNGWKKNNIVYIDFEDIRFHKLSYKDYPSFIKIIHEIFEELDGKLVLLLDEIQNLENYDLWLRTLHNRGKYYIFVTGSSFSLIEKEVASKLRGRYKSKILLPFSFKEFLKAKKEQINVLYSEKEGIILRYLREYLGTGGFPQVVLEKDKDLLKTYLDTIFYRDIIERAKIKDVSVAEIMRDYLLSNSGSYFSISKFKKYLNAMGIKKSKKVLMKYYRAFLDAFFIIDVKKFDYSEKRRKLSPRKIYLIDIGFYNLVPRSSEHLGKKMEHLVAQELLRRGRDFYYYVTKNGEEIDFITRENIFEVTYELDEDHIRKVRRAMEELKLKEAFIITWDDEDVVERFGKRILVAPIWKWLLKGNKYL